LKFSGVSFHKKVTLEDKKNFAGKERNEKSKRKILMKIIFSHILIQF